MDQSIVECLLFFVGLTILMFIISYPVYKARRVEEKHYEEQRKLQAERFKREMDRSRIREAKDKKDWTVEDWIEEFSHRDSKDPEKIKWKEQQIIKRDNFQCRFCGNTDKDSLHAYYKKDSLPYK